MLRSFVRTGFLARPEEHKRIAIHGDFQERQQYANIMGRPCTDGDKQTLVNPSQSLFFLRGALPPILPAPRTLFRAENTLAGHVSHEQPPSQGSRATPCETLREIPSAVAFANTARNNLLRQAVAPRERTCRPGPGQVRLHLLIPEMERLAE
jgi:hypothetical protein